MRSARRSLCATMLVLQAVVVGLTTPVMISVLQVELSTALGVGLGLAGACLVTAGLLPRTGGYLLGWAVQVASVGLGFVVPMMFLLGVVFAALWTAGYLVGGKVDRERVTRAG
jgi:hypothetical protein